MKYRFTTLSSPVGKLYLVGKAERLHGLFFNPEKMRQHFANDDLIRGDSPVLKKAAQQLKEYFKGQRARFSVPYAFAGTQFQKKIWKELSRIPYGKTVSYRGLASRAGQRKAARAVGNANGQNPICIIVPCHRVIAADGSIGGFTGGIAKKKKLLALEKKAQQRG